MARKSKQRRGLVGPALLERRIAAGKKSSLTGPQTARWDRTLLLQSLVILVAGAWIYWPVLHGGWLLDDDVDILDNPITRSATGLWSIWFVPGSQVDYYPIKASVQWAQWHLWRDDTFGYHVTNIVLHLAGGMLVWRLFARLGLRLAWLGGLLFVVHPTAVESVAWIAELKNTLSMPPFLLAMCFYLDYDGHRRLRDVLLSFVCFGVALLCKTSMVMFPVAILLHAWWKRGRIARGDLKASAPFFLLSLGMGLMTLSVGPWFGEIHHRSADVVPLGGFFSRAALAGLSTAFYFSKAVLPVELMPFYPHWQVDPPTLMQFLPWPVFIGVICILWVKRRTWGRHVFFGLGFFLIMLLPFVTMNVGGYTTMTWVMDHFLYIPILGLIGLAVAAVDQMDRLISASLRPVAIVIVAAVLALLAWGSHAYAKKFINQETLWTYTLKHNPEAWLAHNNLGIQLLLQGRVEDAIEQFRETLEIKSDYVFARSNWGVALIRTGRLSEGIQHFQEALRLDPNYSAAQKNWGDALVAEGKYEDAIPHYQEALRLNPDFAGVENNWGKALFAGGKIPEAIEHFLHALQLEPDFAEAHYNVGNALAATGHDAGAIAHFQEAVRFDPFYADAYNNWGAALVRNGRFPEGIRLYQEALKLRPDYAEVYNNWGNALLAEGQVADAIQQFQEAVLLKPSYAEAHYDWGIALVRAGQLMDAITQFREALRLKPNYPMAHNNLGVVLTQLGRKTEAIEQFREALQLDPGNSEAKRNLAAQTMQGTGPAGK